MKQFNDTIEKLKSDPMHAVTVVELDRLKPIVSSHTGKMLTEKYGSVETFFEKVFADGHRKLKIVDRRKNGSEYKFIGSYDFEMQPATGSDPIQPPVTVPAAAHVAPNAPVELFGGLNAPGGLNAAMVYQYMDHPRLSQECAQLRAENKLLQDKVQELKEQNLRNEITEGKTVETRKAQTDLMTSFAPLLAPLISKITSTAETAPGLAGAESLSPAKREAFTLIQSLDESSVRILNILMANLHIESFGDSIYKALEEHGLIAKED